jgi:hypothetical protein
VHAIRRKDWQEGTNSGCQTIGDPTDDPNQQRRARQFRQIRLTNMADIGALNKPNLVLLVLGIIRLIPHSRRL